MSIDVLGICAIIVAIGGALEVLRRMVIGPLIKGLRLIEQLVRDVASLLERTDKIESKVATMQTDLSEIKGALHAVGLLPNDDG